MANYQTMQNDINLTGMAGLISTDVGALLNKVQREEIEVWQWSFLWSNIVINSTIPISSGTINTTQGSPTVTGTLTAFTAAMSNWWLRTGATQTTPVLVAGVNAVSQTLTLSQPWAAASQTGATYTMFPRFYPVNPLIEVYGVRQILPLQMWPQEKLNMVDPSRIDTGGDPSSVWSPAGFNQAGNYQIEPWPVPASSLPYIVEGKRGPVDMVNPTDLPQLPSAVLEAKAMMYMARSIYASNGNPKWLELANVYSADYQRELDAARAADKKRFVTRGLSEDPPDGGGWSPGLDVIYNHDFRR